MDSDGNGTVDFKEFVVGMGILGAPVSTDAADADVAASPFAAFVFRLLDVSNTGRVPRDEVISVVWRHAELVEAETEAELESIRAKERVRRLRAEDQDAVDVEAADVVGSRAGFESYHDQIYRRGDQTEAKALSRRQTDLEWLVSWAEDEARAKIPPDPKKIKALADLDRRRRSVANVRRHARDAAQTLRREVPARISPRDLSRFLVGVSSPVLGGEGTVRHVQTLPRAVRGGVRGRTRTQTRGTPRRALGADLEGGSEPDVVPRQGEKIGRRILGDHRGAPREARQRRELLAELADMSRRRAAAEAAKHREFKSAGGRGDAPVAAAGLGDQSAATRVGRDGRKRCERLFRGPRATGKSRSTAESARMRVDALMTTPPAHAVEELGHVSERARVLALTMLPAAAAARTCAACHAPARERTCSQTRTRGGTRGVGDAQARVVGTRAARDGGHERRDRNVPGDGCPGRIPRRGRRRRSRRGDEGATRARLAEQERARVRRDVLDDEEVYVYTGAMGRVAGGRSTAARRVIRRCDDR